MTVNVPVHRPGWAGSDTFSELKTRCRVHLSTISISGTPLETFTGTCEWLWTTPHVKIKADTVVISRGLFRCRRSAFAAPRGYHTSALLTSNVWQRCGLLNRRFHVCLLSSAEARRHPSGEYMLHAWLVDLLVAEPRKVAQVTAKVDRVPAVFRLST